MMITDAAEAKKKGATNRQRAIRELSTKAIEERTRYADMLSRLPSHQQLQALDTLAVIQEQTSGRRHSR